MGKVKQTELELQKSVVAYAKKAYGLQPVVNVHNMIPWPKEQKRRGQISNRMTSLGFQPGQPDLIFLKSFTLGPDLLSSTRDFYGFCAIELKTDDKDPFRKTKSGDFYIDNSGDIFETKTSEEKEHILKQAKYLADITRDHGFGAFAAGFDQAKKILDICYGKETALDLEIYEFPYGWEPKNRIFRILM